MELSLESLSALIPHYLFKIVGALFVVLIGFKIVSYLIQLLDELLKKYVHDRALRGFLSSASSVALKVMVLISAGGLLGVKTTAFITVLGAFSLAIGMAFQGSLSNVAGGILLLMVRPFNVGDYIEAADINGVVEQIGIVYTKLRTFDNKIVTIPNGSLANNNITNYTNQTTRRVDLVFGASYDAPIDRVVQAIEQVIAQHDKILAQPEPFVRLSKHSDSSLDYTVRVWTKTEDYWPVHFDLIEAVKKKFDEENIAIPFGTYDINIFNNHSQNARQETSE